MTTDSLSTVDPFTVNTSCLVLHCYVKHYKNIRIRPQYLGGNPDKLLSKAEYFKSCLEGIFSRFSCHLSSLLDCSVKDEGTKSLPNCHVKLLSFQDALGKGKAHLWCDHVAQVKYIFIAWYIWEECACFFADIKVMMWNNEVLRTQSCGTVYITSGIPLGTL